MLKLQNINLSFGAFSISNINFELERGDYFVLLGPSGAGKSVVLELIAGILHPDSGHVFLNGEDISTQKIQERSVGLVFQDFAIFPHLNVQQNIAYPLKVKHLPKKEIQKRVNELALQMDIEHLLLRDTKSLSGGEKQRVALARTLALSPDLLLLDEPLASLDVQLKKDLRRQLRKLHKQGQTIIHVTHDFEEALLLADKVAIFHKGQIVQIGTKNKVFEQPQSEFVANFIGIKNYFEVTAKSGNKLTVAKKITLICNDAAEDKTPTAVMIHSGDIALRKAEHSNILPENTFEGRLIDVYQAYRGYELIIDVGLPLVVNISQKQMMQLSVVEGDTLLCMVSSENIRLID